MSIVPTSPEESVLDELFDFRLVTGEASAGVTVLSVLLNSPTEIRNDFQLLKWVPQVINGDYEVHEGQRTTYYVQIGHVYIRGNNSRSPTHRKCTVRIPHRHQRK